MEGQSKEPVKKVSGVTNLSEKKASLLIGIKTRMGMYVGEEETSDDGEIIGLKHAVEMIYFPTPQGLAFISLLVGNITEFPEDCMTIEIDNKSQFRKEYAKEMSGIVSPIMQ